MMCQKKRLLLFCISILCLTFLIACQERQSEEDQSVNTLEEYYANEADKFAAIQTTISNYYPDYAIDKCSVQLTNDVFSRFDPSTNTILLAKQHENRSVRTIAHEISHIALATLTNNANLQNNHRFFDEGMAEIVGYSAINELEDYKQRSLNAAREQLAKGNLDFRKVQDWDVYYDRYGNNNSYAYLVGASFVFFVIDDYGIDKLYEMYADLAVTKDMAVSVQNVWQLSLEDFEKEWIDYLQ